MFRLAAFAIVTFELHGQVADVELMLEQRGHVAQDAFMVGAPSDHRVRRERELPAGQTPDKKVMQFLGAS
jgi:hypothetical protein